jgi:hypothetical protein
MCTYIYVYMYMCTYIYVYVFFSYSIMANVIALAEFLLLSERCKLRCFVFVYVCVFFSYPSFSFTYLLTYVRSWALSEKLPIVQPLRKLPAILRNPKVHHRVHKSPPLVPILSQFDPAHTIPSFLSKIHYNIVHPPTSWSSQWSLSFWLSHQYPICIPFSYTLFITGFWVDE